MRGRKFSGRSEEGKERSRRQGRDEHEIPESLSISTVEAHHVGSGDGGLARRLANDDDCHRRTHEVSSSQKKEKKDTEGDSPSPLLALCLICTLTPAAFSNLCLFFGGGRSSDRSEGDVRAEEAGEAGRG